MAYERMGESPIEYQRCQYGKSKLLFRGPKCDIDKPYLAFLGGTETYGKYVMDPFPTLVSDACDLQSVNLGAVNAGIDVFINETCLHEICAGARATVIQVLGAQNMTNRFYSVHPRRNDRFLTASATLQAIYAEVDFTEFTFTRHMLLALRKTSPEKFDTVVLELQTAWTARMALLLKKIPSRKILLWVCDDTAQYPYRGRDLGAEPLFITRGMIEEIEPLVDDVVEVAVDTAMRASTEGMLFPDLEQSIAQEVCGPSVHAMIAQRLVPTLSYSV